MCVIVHLEPKKTIAKETLRDCFTTNRDGWGIMWAKNGKVHAVKDKTDFEDFYKLWQQVPKDVTRALHFRIRTAGEVNRANCHPFRVTDDVWLMHNGMIDAVMLDEKMSDTWNFVAHELRPIVQKWPNFMQSKAFEKLMEEVTGYSKLLFLNSKGEVLKVRNNVWVERQGIYFSNGNSLRSYSYGYGGNSRSSGYWEKGVFHPYSTASNYAPPARTPTHSPNHYNALTDRIAQIDEADSQFNESNIHSDLFSGNKTEAEGQRYLEELEKQRVDTLAEYVARADGDDLPESEDFDGQDEDDISLVPSVEDVCNWSDQDTMDWMQDNPRSATLFLQGLLDTLIQFKAIDEANAFIGKEITRRVATS